MLNLHRYRCPICTEIGFTNETLQEHINRVHPHSTIHLVCPLRRVASAGDSPQLLQTNNLAGNSNLRRRSASARLQQDLTNSSASVSATSHRQIARRGSRSVQSRNRRRRGSISPTNMRNACLALMSAGPIEASSPLNANLERASSVLEENLPVLLRPRSLSVPLNNRRPQIARRISRSWRLRTPPTSTNNNNNQPNNDDQSQSSSSSLSSNLRGNRSQTARRSVWRRRTGTDQREFVAAATNEAESGTSVRSSTLHQIPAESLLSNNNNNNNNNNTGRSNRIAHQFVAQGGSNSVRSRIMAPSTSRGTNNSLSSMSNWPADWSVASQELINADNQDLRSINEVDAADSSTTDQHQQQEYLPSENDDDDDDANNN